MSIVNFGGHAFHTSKMIRELGPEAFGLTRAEWLQEYRLEVEEEKLGAKSDPIQNSHGSWIAPLNTIDGSKVLLFEKGQYLIIRSQDFLEGLDFGKDNAEAEILDSFLDHVFVVTESLMHLLQESKTIVIGRRGTGKSAIAYYLTKEHKGCGCGVIFHPGDTAWNELNAKDVHCYRLFWHFTLLVAVANEIVARERSRVGDDQNFWNRETRNLYKLLVKCFQAEPLTFPGRVIQTCRKCLTKIQLTLYGVSAYLEFGAKENQTHGYRRLIRLFENIIRQTPGPDGVVVLVDQLDSIWDASVAARNCLIALLEATKTVNSLCKNVRILVFIRTEVYASLQWADKEQVRSEEFHIEWSSGELECLLASRVKERLKSRMPTIMQVGSSEILKTVFPSLGDMRYLLNRSFLRPRDLIQLTNCIRDVCIRRKHPHVVPMDIMEGVVRYSAWKVEDVAEEYKHEYPLLKDAFRSLVGTRIPLSREDLLCRLACVPVEGRVSEKEEGRKTAEDLLNVLYKISIIGVVRSGKAIFDYTYGGYCPMDAEHFVVHPAIGHALHIDGYEEEMEIQGFPGAG